jgi:uncharacterized membrane protein YphA (DoxX/SURF4 family)
MRSIFHWFSSPPHDAPKATILLRLMAGSVFLWEGILKFVYVNQGVGRFTKLGFPFPDFTASFVGGLEIVGGLLILLGLGTRFVAVPFLGGLARGALRVRPAVDDRLPAVGGSGAVVR